MLFQIFHENRVDNTLIDGLAVAEQCLPVQYKAKDFLSSCAALLHEDNWQAAPFRRSSDLQLSQYSFQKKAV